MFQTVTGAMEQNDLEDENENIEAEEVTEGVEAGNDDVGTEKKFDPKNVIRAPSSIVWKFFHFKGTKQFGPKRNQVFCNICCENQADGKMQKGIKFLSGTTNLSDHLKNKHKAELKAAEDGMNKNASTEDPKQPLMNSYCKLRSSMKWPKTGVRWKKATLQLTKFLIKDSRPANLVEGEGFKAFIAEVCPEYEVPTAQTITNYMDRMYDAEKAKIVTELEVEAEFCSMTTDGGSATNGGSFQDTNVHFINNDIQLKYRCLSVKENKESHSATNYRKNTDEVAEEFKFAEKIVKTVTDNEPKMHAAYDDEERTGCVSHIIHKSVEAGTTRVKTVNQIILKMRKIGRKHNKSYKLRYGLEREQQKRNLKVKPIQQDVVNRWGSTRVAAESYLDERKKNEEDEKSSDVFEEEFNNCEAINKALRGLTWKKSKKVAGKSAHEKLEDYLLTRSDMLKIRNLHAVLTSLDVYSTTLGGAHFVTSSIVMPVVKSIKKLLKMDEEDTSYISEMKEIILKDFKDRSAKNLDGKFLLKTTALDPRFKNLKVLDVKEARDKVFQELEKEAKKMAKDKDTETIKEVEDITKVKKRKMGLDFDESDEDGEEYDEIKKEIESYRQEPMVDRDEDVLDWWRKRKSKYPHLVRMVRYKDFFNCFLFLYN